MIRRKRLGVLTGGGDCSGLNAVIRAITKPAEALGYEVYGFEDGFLGLIECRYRLLKDREVSGILSKGGTILGTSNRANPFRHPITKDKKLTFVDLSKKVLKNYKNLKLDGVIAIGGDGTLKIALGLSKLGMKIIGVPKTIDNDLSETDLTFGFDSAVAVATEAIDRLHTTAESHHRVMVLEVMGRYAGWIALYAGVAGGGDIILIPEIPFDLKKVCEKVERRVRQGKRFSIVVVAEGAYPKDGGQMVSQRVEESTDPVRLGGVGAYVAREVERLTSLESRFTVLGHLQRGGAPTAFDRLLATRFGYEALRLAVQGEFGDMVALKGDKIHSVPIARAVGRLKTVPLNHPLVQAARAVGTSFGD